MDFKPIESAEGMYNQLVIASIGEAGRPLTVLVDTGASVPVWTCGSDVLKLYYPQAVDTGYKMYLSGFGGNGTEVPVWKIPRFTLSDGVDSIVYENLHVAVSDRASRFGMVISFPMLRNAVITYVSPGNKVAPSLSIKFSRSVILTNPTFSMLEGNRYMSGMNVYMQNDYTFSKLIRDPFTLMAVMEKHENYEEWFNDNFPDGASDAEEVIKRLETEELQHG